MVTLTTQVYQPSTGDYVYYDKWYGRSITEDTALQGICIYLNPLHRVKVYVYTLTHYIGLIALSDKCTQVCTTVRRWVIVEWANPEQRNWQAY